MKLNASRTRLLLGVVAVALALMAMGAAGAQAKLVKVTGIHDRRAVRRRNAVPGERRRVAWPRGSRHLGRARDSRSRSPPASVTPRPTTACSPTAAASSSRKGGKSARASAASWRSAPASSPCCWRRSPAPRVAASTSRAAARKFAMKPDRNSYTDPWAKLRYPKAVKRVIKPTKRTASRVKRDRARQPDQPGQVGRRQDRDADRRPEPLGPGGEAGEPRGRQEGGEARARCSGLDRPRTGHAAASSTSKRERRHETGGLRAARFSFRVVCTLAQVPSPIARAPRPDAMRETTPTVHLIARPSLDLDGHARLPGGRGRGLLARTPAGARASPTRASCSWSSAGGPATAAGSRG